ASNGSVTATTDADFCCVGATAAIATTAGGNSITSTGSTTTSIQGAVQTTATGETIQAVSDVYAGSANGAIVTTTASGNSYVLHNEWGYTSLGREGSELYQGNESEIDARSWVTLDNWNGHAAVSSYGVGNSAVVGNIGSDTALHTIQSNFGAVGSQASFDGASATGGVAQLTSTSIGNAASATLCTACNDASLSGTVSQFNSGNIYATGIMNAPNAGVVIGTATAIGNSATFQTGNMTSTTNGD
ncbi:MAG: holdfast anchor protein HfaD, partial [Pseudomonadota bacterium]